MWVVVEINNKQYLVKERSFLEVEKLKEDSGKIILDKVLLFVDNDRVEIGKPYLENVKVEAEVKSQVKGDKIISYKYRRRKKSRWKKGHRQIYTNLLISRIIHS